MRVLAVGLLVGMMTGMSALAASATPPVTFNKDVLPILQKRCQECHRPGEVAPMSLMTYQETRPWAKAIKGAVSSKKMPPWFADVKYGHFANDRSLSGPELAAIVAWVDAGSPEGNPKDKPAPVQFPDGWSIKPDVVISMSKPIDVPATGIQEYTYMLVPTGFTKDTWVTAAEVRPTNRGVVHHIIAYVRPPGSSYMKELKYGEASTPGAGRPRDENGMPVATARARLAQTQPAQPPQLRLAPPQPAGDPQLAAGEASNEFLAAYGPGLQSQKFAVGVDDAAKLVPAGSDIVLQLHYTPNGKAIQDQTKIALTLATKPPQHRFLTLSAINMGFAIPPNDPNYETRASATLATNAQLVWLLPHMHLRGKDMLFKLTYPTGEAQTLLNIPNYDFNWQVSYDTAKPIALPKGSRIDVTAHHDNSANNKYNPNPNLTIHWGDQSWEEMMIGWFGVVVDANVNPKTVLARGGRQAE